MKVSAILMILLAFQQSFSMTCEVAVSGFAPASLDQVVQEKIKTASLLLKSSLNAESDQTQSFSGVLRSFSRNSINESVANTVKFAQFFNPTAGTESSQTVQSVIQAFAQLKSGAFKKGWGFGGKKAEAALRESIVVGVKVLRDRLPVVTERLLEVGKNLVLIEGSVAQLKAEMQVLEAVKKLLLTKKVAESGRINLPDTLLQTQDIENLIQGTLKTLSEQKETISKMEVLLKEEQVTISKFLNSQLDQLTQSIENDPEFSKKIALTLQNRQDEVLKNAVDQALANSKVSALTPELLETPFRPLMHGDQVKVYLIREFYTKRGLGNDYEISQDFSAQIEVDSKKRKYLVYWAQKFNSLTAQFSSSNPSIQQMKLPLGEFSDHNPIGSLSTFGRGRATMHRYGREKFPYYGFKVVLANPEMKIGKFRIGDKLKVKISDSSELLHPKTNQEGAIFRLIFEHTHNGSLFVKDSLNQERAFEFVKSADFEVIGTLNDSVALSINSKSSRTFIWFSLDILENFFKPLSP